MHKQPVIVRDDKLRAEFAGPDFDPHLYIAPRIPEGNVVTIL